MVAVKYFPEDDILWAHKGIPIRGGTQLDEERHLDLDKDGNVCGVVIGNASRDLNLTDVPEEFHDAINNVITAPRRVQEAAPAFQHPGYPVLLDLRYSSAEQHSILPELLAIKFRLDNEPTWAEAYVPLELLDLHRCVARASVHPPDCYTDGKLVVVFPPNQDWGPHKFLATPEQIAFMDESHTAPEVTKR